MERSSCKNPLTMDTSYSYKCTTIPTVGLKTDFNTNYINPFMHELSQKKDLDFKILLLIIRLKLKCILKFFF